MFFLISQKIIADQAAPAAQAAQEEAAQNQIIFNAAVQEAARQHANVYDNLATQLNELSRAFREQGLITSIPNFEGDPQKFKIWLQAVEKVALLAEMGDQRKRLLAYQTAGGPVAEFLGRFLEQHPQGGWEALKRE